MKKLSKGIAKLFARIFFNAKGVLALFIITLAAFGAAGYLYHENKKMEQKISDPTVASNQEISDLTARVGKFMDLPQDEKPTIITVVDKSKLSDQQFFAKSENGDKVLVYTAAKEAIIYRPSTNKIIAVGPVDLTPKSTFKVALYNGSSLAISDDLASAAQKTLADKVTNLQFLDIESTQTKNYTANTVIDLSGSHSNEATQLAQIINGTVGTLPSIEVKPDADFMIIVAK